MAKLSYVDPATASEDVRKVLEMLPAKLNIFHMMAHAESNFRPLLRLGTSILAEQKLDATLRELAILQVAKLSPAEYEWVQHVPIAKAVGASEEQIAAVERGDAEAACFDERQRLVLRFTAELVAGVRAADSTFRDLVTQFSAREIVELILAIGYYMMLARLMETTGIDVDPPAGEQVIAQARRQSRGNA
jgi:alkylhydroperoxidase family enzyme